MVLLFTTSCVPYSDDVQITVRPPSYYYYYRPHYRPYRHYYYYSPRHRNYYYRHDRRRIK